MSKQRYYEFREKCSACWERFLSLAVNFKKCCCGGSTDHLRQLEESEKKHTKEIYMNHMSNAQNTSSNNSVSALTNSSSSASEKELDLVEVNVNTEENLQPKSAVVSVKMETEATLLTESHNRNKQEHKQAEMLENEAEQKQHELQITSTSLVYQAPPDASSDEEWIDLEAETMGESED